MKFVACIGEDKLTRDRIRETRMFSATVVTRSLLARANQRLTADTPLAERMAMPEPVVTLNGQYYGVESGSLGAWGTPIQTLA